MTGLLADYLPLIVFIGVALTIFAYKRVKSLVH